jgi:hypothetical protein
MITTFSNNTLEILQFGILAIVQGCLAVVWLLMHGMVRLWSYRRTLATVAAFAGAVAVFAAYPLLLVGLLVTTIFAMVTYPKTAVRA